MGPPQAMDVLNYALGMGCDECYLLSDRAFGGADTLATGYALSKAAEKIGELISVHVIPRPHTEVDGILPHGRDAAPA